MMSKTFLYQLFNYSKPAFTIVIIFIAGYAFFFAKSMDMLVFPHNSMFAYTTADSNKTVKIYAVKLNGTSVSTTKFLYWKKDFIEAALSTYADYIEQDKTVYLNQYLISNKWIPENAQQMMLPQHAAATTWLPWLIKYTGHTTKGLTKIDLYSYTISFKNKRATVIDSTLIYTQKTVSL